MKKFKLTINGNVYEVEIQDIEDNVADLQKAEDLGRLDPLGIEFIDLASADWNRPRSN